MLTRKRLLAVKAEATSGTAESPTGTDATIRVFDPKMTGNKEWVKMQQTGSASYGPGVPGALAAELTFSTYLVGKGSAGDATWATVLLTASSWAVSTAVWKPATGQTSTLTGAFYQDGRLRKIAGAAGTFVMRGENGKPVLMDWRFAGKRVDPTTASLLAPTLDTTIPPRFAGGAITVGGTAYKVWKFEYDPGQKITIIPDANDATGYAFAVVADRDPSFKIWVAGQTSHDFYADHKAGTTAALSAVIGSASNNTWTLAAPKLQLVEDPSDEDKDGVQFDGLMFQPIANTSAGDDETSLTSS